MQFISYIIHTMLKVYSKKVFVALVAMTAVLAVITVALYIAGGSGGMGQVIDEQFLATLARQEYYKAVGKVFRGLAFFTGCTTFVYVIGLDMHKRRDIKPHMQTEKLGYKNKISGRNMYQGSLVIKSFLALR